MARVMCVLRSGGEYRPEHVQALARQVPELTVLSDVDVPGVPRIALKHDWRSWWAKMELFDPTIPGDLIYFDLDTVIVGGIGGLKSLDRTTLLSDFYYPERPASGVMYLTEADRAKVWVAWMADPDSAMRQCMREGDQKFIGSVLRDAQRFQDVLPGQVVSYKVHVAKGYNRRSVGDGSIPDGARVVCFHGKPRPWHVEEEWVPDYG